MGTRPGRIKTVQPTPGVAFPDPNQPHDPFLAVGAPLKTFVMPTVAQANANPTLPDPRLQVPMMVGDFVTYSGHPVQD